MSHYSPRLDADRKEGTNRLESLENKYDETYAQLEKTKESVAKRQERVAGYVCLRV